jgi:hypothetical protein
VNEQLRSLQVNVGAQMLRLNAGAAVSDAQLVERAD